MTLMSEPEHKFLNCSGFVQKWRLVRAAVEKLLAGFQGTAGMTKECEGTGRLSWGSSDIDSGGISVSLWYLPFVMAVGLVQKGKTTG